MLPWATGPSSAAAILTAQAVRAVETLNGTDLGGRKILVREDREDKDVKNYNRCASISPDTCLLTVCFVASHLEHCASLADPAADTTLSLDE